jgi:hypothetical protein
MVGWTVDVSLSCECPCAVDMDAGRNSGPASVGADQFSLSSTAFAMASEQSPSAFSGGIDRTRKTDATDGKS